MARPLNYTTKIPAKRTAAECFDLLMEAGADHVLVSYEDKRPAGLRFMIDTAGGRRDFLLPIGAAAMGKVLRRELNASRPHVSAAEFDRMLGAEHASNVAWRVVRDWLAAQLALIAAGLAELDQVMLPYLQVEAGETLYDRYLAAQGQLALTGGDL
jgi:hypothetical protein